MDTDQLAKGIDGSMGPPAGGPGPMGFPGARPQELRSNVPSGPMMFGGPGVFIAPAFMAAGDLDHDGRLTETEFSGLFGKWVREWDADHDGKLTMEEIADGFSKVNPRANEFRQGGPQGRGQAPAK